MHRSDPPVPGDHPVPSDGPASGDSTASWRLPDRPEDADVTDLDDLLRVDERLGAPIGRRIVLGLSALGVVGVLTGRAVQDRLRAVLDEAPGGRLLNETLPTGGRFRIYTVTGGYPKREPADWQLTVDGLVERPLTLDFATLTDREPTHLTKDFQCVTGWRVDDVEWTGVRVAELLDEAGVRPEATALRIHSFDGVYTESLTLEQARRDDVLVAWSMQDEPISRAHGGPVRLYVAPMYGYKSLKWLDRIEVVDEVIPGYWEERGYAVDAWIGRSNGRDDAPA